MTLADLLPLLACPTDLLPLSRDGAELACASGHRFAIVDEVPILLRDDVSHPHWVAEHALEVAAGRRQPEPYVAARTGVDPFVQQAIGATGGYMYGPLIGRLTHYPIPELPMPRGDGEWLLDVGCNWGRWTIAAARHGYAAIGIDPSLEGVRAAKRVCAQLGIDAAFVVADARYLPFATGCLPRAFSYSVLQHLSKAEAATSFASIARVLAPGGMALIQMPNAFGVRSLYHRARRGFGEGERFDVRYWTAGELRALAERAIGPTKISVDGFFSLNAQPAEAPLLPWRYRVVVRTSTLLKRVATRLPALTALADSFWVSAQRRG